MTDPNFNDLKIFSKGPQADMEIEDSMPELEPALIIAPSFNDTKQQAALPTSLPRSTEPASAPKLEPAYIELTEMNTKDGQ